MAGWKLHPLRRRQFKGVIASGTEWSVAIFRIASRNDSLEVGCGRLEVRI